MKKHILIFLLIMPFCNAASYDDEALIRSGLSEGGGFDMVLVLPNRNLDEIPNAVTVDNLVSINLSGNNITQIPENFSHLFGFNAGQDLIDLNLGYNKIQEVNIVEILKQLPNLYKLNLGSNQITTNFDLVGASANVNRKIRNLDLGGNKIEHFNLTSILKAFPNLEELNLEDNQITTNFDLAGANVNEKMSSLNLKGNKVQHFNFASVLKAFPNLKNLDLEGNEITNFDLADVNVNEEMIYLDLSGNKIEHFNLASVLKAFPNLEQLDLSGNPLPQDLVDKLWKEEGNYPDLLLDLSQTGDMYPHRGENIKGK